MLVNLSPIGEQWSGKRELRSAFLRFGAFAILLGNLILSGDGQRTYFVVTISYLAISVISFVAAAVSPQSSILKILFVVLDAFLIVLLLREHLLGGPITANHNLTTTSLVVAFILLNHVSLKMDHQLVAVFSTIVITAWVGILGVVAYRHHPGNIATLLSSFLNQDLGLTISFGFTSLAVYLFAKDHDSVRREAVKLNEKRLNLSRYFSPSIVSDLQEASSSLGLERRDAVIMFIDLRGFTAFAETASPNDLALVLADYRRLVAGVVYAHGGMIDKFIGDGIMAVFGQPMPEADDPDSALECALALVDALDQWKLPSALENEPVLKAGIGMHFGAVVGGVLKSGYHDEFTVIGDVVNVAQRLESLAKELDASLVVSFTLMENLTKEVPAANWHWQRSVNLPGRQVPIDVVYLSR